MATTLLAAANVSDDIITSSAICGRPVNGLLCLERRKK